MHSMQVDIIINAIQTIDLSIDDINEIRRAVHEKSPFKNEPVDFVEWIPNDQVYANDYNPNTVAPPEMELLRVSIAADGYTQPIVTMPDSDGRREVIDGFHRHRVGKETDEIRSRVHSHLPVVSINETRYDKADRMAATIRHNRARGKHRVDAMSDIVIELKHRNWSDEKIAKNLGMEADEVLRLCQISGLSELFADQEFSKSWDTDDIQDEFAPLRDDEGGPVKIEDGRILHTWDQWECYRAGFYETTHALSKEQCEATYRDLLRDIPSFETALSRVISEWPNSCEHYLTNDRMNRIAWLGQASLCIAKGIPACFRNGFNLLTASEQTAANEAALKGLNRWLTSQGRVALTMDQVTSKTEANLY